MIATEAFDLAGDPTAFREQLAAPRDRNNIGNLTEGLEPWQPKKLYYFSDATNPSFQSGKGPRYSTEDRSPAKVKRTTSLLPMKCPSTSPRMTPGRWQCRR